jgi:hypothetical protein
MFCRYADEAQTEFLRIFDTEAGFRRIVIGLLLLAPKDFLFTDDFDFLFLKNLVTN